MSGDMTAAARRRVAVGGTAGGAWPRPTSPRPKKKSPTMAPMTDSPAEMRRPANIAGSAAGNITLRRRVKRLAWWSVTRSCRPGRPTGVRRAC